MLDNYTHTTLTGSLQADSVRQALAVNADAYVLKHEDDAEFLHAIHIVLGHQQSAAINLGFYEAT